MIRKLLKSIAEIVTLLIIICHTIAWIAPIINPNTTVIAALFGILTPLWLVLMIAACCFWIIRTKWLFATIVAAIIAISFPSWRKTVTIHTTASAPENCDTIKLLTYNTQRFGSEKNFMSIINFLEEENADIVCLQEFGYYKSDKFNQDIILKELDRLYPYRHIWYKNQSKRSNNGLITLSKFPIVKKQKIEYNSRYNISIYSDILFGSDTLRIINNHLESNKLNKEDKAIATMVSENFESEQFTETSMSIVRKMRRAIIYRAQQADAIAEVIKNSNHKTIVMGDFNDVTQSYTYHTIAGEMKDIYIESGSLLYYWTFNQNLLYFAIDHILIDQTFYPINAKISKIDYSDHYPLSGKIAIPKK